LVERGASDVEDSDWYSETCCLKLVPTHALRVAVAVLLRRSSPGGGNQRSHG